MKFNLKALTGKANEALKASGADKLVGAAKDKAAEAKAKIAPMAEEAGKRIVEADKIVTAKVDEAKAKIADVISKGRGPK